MHLSPYVAAALLAVLFALADRWNGGGLGWNRLTVDHGGRLHGRPVYYSALPLALACYLIGGGFALVIAAAWMVYRSALGFPTDTLTGEDLPATWMHHLIIGAFAAIAVLMLGLPVVCVLPFALYVVAAVVLAKWNGDAIKRHGDVNGRVELVRGWAFGLALGVSLAGAKVISLSA